MNTRHTKILFAAAAAGLTLTSVGCSSQAEARREAMLNQSYAYATPGGSLGAGDGLGQALFTETGQTRMALFRTAESAFEVAEAKEAEGAYDAWYASFIKPGDPGYAAALAKAKGADDDSDPAVPGEDEPVDTGTFAEVPVPTE